MENPNIDLLVEEFRKKNPQLSESLSNDDILEILVEEEIKHEKESPIAVISFALLKNGNIDFDLQFIKETEQTANESGKLLYLINNGDLKKFCIDKLNKCDNKIFSGKIFEAWAECIKNTEKAIIAPSKVIMLNNNSQDI